MTADPPNGAIALVVTPARVAPSRRRRLDQDARRRRANALLPPAIAGPARGAAIAFLKTHRPRRSPSCSPAVFPRTTATPATGAGTGTTTGTWGTRLGNTVPDLDGPYASKQPVLQRLLSVPPTGFE